MLSAHSKCNRISLPEDRRSLPKQLSPAVTCLSVIVLCIWHRSWCVSKYTSVPEDIYKSSLANTKHDEQAPSAGGKLQLRQNHSLPQKNYQKHPQHAFPLTNFSPSCPILLSPVLSPCPTPRCPATCQQHSSATPPCTHRVLSQLLGESHFLGVHETDKWEISCQNQCVNPLTAIIAFIIFPDRFTWPFKGQKYSSFKLIALSSLCQLQ